MISSQNLYAAKEDFFEFMKTKYYLFKHSNIFFRDLLYAIKHYFEQKSYRLSYSESEKLAQEFAELSEKDGIIKKINNNTWVLLQDPSAKAEELTGEIDNP